MIKNYFAFTLNGVPPLLDHLDPLLEGDLIVFRAWDYARATGSVIVSSDCDKARTIGFASEDGSERWAVPLVTLSRRLKFTRHKLADFYRTQRGREAIAALISQGTLLSYLGDLGDQND